MVRQKSWMQSPVYWVLFALMFVVWAIFGLTAYHRGRMTILDLVLSGSVFLFFPLKLYVKRRMRIRARG